MNKPVSMQIVVAFLIAFLSAMSSSFAQDNVAFLRGDLNNSRLVFEKTKHGSVAFIGGSITAGYGWRDMTGEILKKNYPETEFNFINAGVGGTNSTFGAFRFDSDVLSNGKIDLLFLEFAVNDDGGSSPDNRSARAMEGIIRHARKANPNIDIVMLYFADQGKVESYRSGKTPDVIAEHDRIAEYYGISSLHLAREVVRILDAGEIKWEEFSRDSCHPLERGHAIYADWVDKLLTAAWAEKPQPKAEPKPHEEPSPLDPSNYENGRFIPLEQARIVKGWNRIPQWDTEKKCNYAGAVDVLAAETPGDVLELEFEGTLIGMYAIAGMDAGVLAATIDGSAPIKFDLFDGYCAQFHRPVCRVLAENLTPGKHLLRLEMLPESNPQSNGHAARVLKFTAN